MLSGILERGWEVVLVTEVLKGFSSLTVYSFCAICEGHTLVICHYAIKLSKISRGTRVCSGSASGAS